MDGEFMPNADAPLASVCRELNFMRSLDIDADELRARALDALVVNARVMGDVATNYRRMALRAGDSEQGPHWTECAAQADRYVLRARSLHRTLADRPPRRGG